MRTLPLGFILPVVLAPSGCGGSPEIEGGTPGIVHMNSVPLADVQVSLYESGADPTEPLAFGISDSEGRFVLRRHGSLEAVWLDPGEYSCTIESTGEFLLHWPAEFRSPRDTPLKMQWTSAEKELDLNVPEPEASY